MISQQTAARTDAVALRTGAELLRSLDGGRQILLDGEQVGSIAGHPALLGAARSLTNMLDLAAAPRLRERLTYPPPIPAAGSDAPGKPRAHMPT